MKGGEKKIPTGVPGTIFLKTTIKGGTNNGRNSD
jgi:hypothetical protein